jgi:hypothetical protein
MGSSRSAHWCCPSRKFILYYTLYWDTRPSAKAHGSWASRRGCFSLTLWFRGMSRSAVFRRSRDTYRHPLFQ